MSPLFLSSDATVICKKMGAHPIISESTDMCLQHMHAHNDKIQAYTYMIHADNTDTYSYLQDTSIYLHDKCRYIQIHIYTYKIQAYTYMIHADTYRYILIPTQLLQKMSKYEA